MNDHNTLNHASMQSLSEDDLHGTVGGSWWNDLVSFGAGVIAGWNSYEPRERVWSEISFPSCECESQ